MAAGAALCGAGDLSCDLLALQLCGHRPPRGRRTAGTRKGVHCCSTPCRCSTPTPCSSCSRSSRSICANGAGGSGCSTSYYVVVNALLVVAVNLGDAVYFRYTQKRFTAEEIFFADNDNSLQLVGKFMAENIPLLLAGIGLIRSAGAGRRPQGAPNRSAVVRSATMAAVRFCSSSPPLLSVAGMRGGHAHDAPRHALQRHALRLRQRPRQPDPLEPLLHPAHRGVRRKDQLRTLLRTGRTGRYLHARPPSRLGRRGTARRTQRGGLRHGEHVGRTLGPPPSNSTPAGRSRATRRFWIRSCRRATASNACTPTAPVRFRRCPPYWDRSPRSRPPFVLMPQALAPTRQLPRILRDKGYATAFFCGSAAGSMGFGAYARSAGIERLYSREDYEVRHGRDDFDGYWGIWDEPFLQYAGEEMSALPEPFFAALFTLLVAPPLRRSRRLPRPAARRAYAQPQVRGLHRQRLPPLFSRVTPARSGSVARFLYSWPIMYRVKNSRTPRASSPATTTSSACCTPPTAHCAAAATRPSRKSTSCPRCSDSWATASLTSAFGRDLFGEQTPEGGLRPRLRQRIRGRRRRPPALLRRAAHDRLLPHGRPAPRTRSGKRSRSGSAGKTRQSLRPAILRIYGKL